MSDTLADECRAMAERAKAASRIVALAPGAVKNAALTAAAYALENKMEAILEANTFDVAAAREAGLSSAMVDRLTLNLPRIQAMAGSMRDIAASPDPIGRVVDSTVRPNGLRIDKVGVPLGVLLFLYESRPNVTADAAGLALKSGNAIILRGGKEALFSNTAIHRFIVEAFVAQGLPAETVQFATTTDRDAVGHLLKLRDLIDLAIPRGGESLIERVCRDAMMPVMKHYRGNCHVYVDRAADLAMAEDIIINAKCERPGVCNAAESLLVHAEVASEFLPRIATALQARSVDMRGCERTRQLVPDVRLADEADFAAEYLDLILSVAVVDNLDAAIDHIARYGSGHTEAIITNDLSASERFAAAVDAAAVIINASTRFHDGAEFGLGAEIGISTDKFHARGPCGVRELTTYKYVVHGHGQVRN